jgi:hypothetical protein
MLGNRFQESKTNCPRGHAYTPENTKLIRSNAPGHFKRQCRACKKITDLASRDRVKLARLAAGTPAAPRKPRAPRAPLPEIIAGTQITLVPITAPACEEIAAHWARKLERPCEARTAPAADDEPAPPSPPLRRRFTRKALAFLEYTGRLQPSDRTRLSICGPSSRVVKKRSCQKWLVTH